MSLQLLDTLSGETRPFVPLHDDRVGVYSCGPTVYGPAHIGNFRSFLFADLLVRHLRWRGWTVTWVMNITDIDDKIIRGAAATGETIETLAERYLTAFLTDAASLRMTTPDVMPRATRYIDEIVSMITTARSSTGSRRGLPTVDWPGWTRRGCESGSGSRRTSTARTMCATSHSGKAPNRVSRRSRRRSGRGDPAGISSARR
jgi:hypothetical protein